MNNFELDFVFEPTRQEMDKSNFLYRALKWFVQVGRHNLPDKIEPPPVRYKLRSGRSLVIKWINRWLGERVT
jgi:hypothetical protein